MATKKTTTPKDKESTYISRQMKIFEKSLADEEEEQTNDDDDEELSDEE